MPDAIYDDGDRLPATYANFLIINGAVLVPTYQQEEKDRQALATIQQAFPDRELVAIDARTAIRQHGSLHCLTMQYPEGVIVPLADDEETHEVIRSYCLVVFLNAKMKVRRLRWTQP